MIKHKELTPDEIEELQLNIITHLKRELAATKEKLARAESRLSIAAHALKELGWERSGVNYIARKAYQQINDIDVPLHYFCLDCNAQVEKRTDPCLCQSKILEAKNTELDITRTQLRAAEEKLARAVKAIQECENLSISLSQNAGARGPKYCKATADLIEVTCRNWLKAYRGGGE